MDELQKRRLRDLLNVLNGTNEVRCGLIVNQGAVILRCPGALYSDSPMLSFSPIDVQNAIDEGLLEKRVIIDADTKEQLYDMFCSRELIWRNHVVESPNSYWQSPLDGQIISQWDGGHICLMRDGFNVWMTGNSEPLHYEHDAETLARYRTFVPDIDQE